MTLVPFSSLLIKLYLESIAELILPTVTAETAVTMPFSTVVITGIGDRLVCSKGFFGAEHHSDVF